MTLDALREAIKASCTEICAAELFRVLKKQEGYLPKFFLVTSQFDPDKASNRLKRGTGAVKVYVASEIIGDPRAVNNGNGTAQVRNLLDTAENKDLLKEDLLENDIIMFLISNYDVKLDNFIPRGDHLIPIDFGNARAEEPLSCDVVSGIDMIRQTKKKHDSSRYASKELRDRFEGGEYISTQSFCKKNLAPEHFLKFIAKVKENQLELERRLYDTAMLYSFGRDEEKREYADVVVSRLRNLVALEPILVEYVEKSGGSSFQNHDLRQIISRSQQFRDDLLSTNHSPGKDFFRFINALFESIDQKSDKLIQSLEFYQEASTEEVS